MAPTEPPEVRKILVQTFIGMVLRAVLGLVLVVVGLYLMIRYLVG